jgi:hypothetical protein
MNTNIKLSNNTGTKHIRYRVHHTCAHVCTATSKLLLRAHVDGPLKVTTEMKLGLRYVSLCYTSFADTFTFICSGKVVTGQHKA